MNARKFTKLEIHSLGFDVFFDRRSMKIEGIFEVPNFVINLISESILENLEELEIEGSKLIDVNNYLFVQCSNLIKITADPLFFNSFDYLEKFNSIENLQ